MSVTDREPIRAPEHDETPRMGGEALLAEAAAAIPAARARLDAMMTDLFLPDAGRLSDFHRATMTRLLARLIERIERAIRGHLAAAGPPPLDGMPGVDDAPVAAPRLARAGVLRDDELTALLLRRAEEQRLGRLLASHTARDRLPPVRLVDELPDPLAAAMVDFLAVAARRHDAFHDLAAADADLPADLYYRLVWWIAAALRDHAISRGAIAVAAIDPPLAAAARAVLAGYDESETLEGRAMRLARALHAAGRLDDAAIARLLAEGAVSLVVAALATRAGIAFSAAWDMAIDGAGSRLVVLLRAIDMARASAADIVFRLAVAGGGDAADAAARRIEAFAALDPAEARAALMPWRLDEGYRRAIADLARGEAPR